MLTGLLMKNGRGFEIENFGWVELNIAGPTNFKVFLPGQCKISPGCVWPGLLYRDLGEQISNRKGSKLKGNVMCSTKKLHILHNEIYL